MSLIQLENVSRHFMLGDETVAALADFSLRVEAGDYLAIMGASGSGKSTLLNLLGLLDRPSTGRYLLDGIDTANLDDSALADLRGHAIGFIFQSFHLIPRLSARENIELPLMLTGMAPRERKERSDQLLAELGLTNRADHKPAELSGGQRQRVAIGRAMAMKPRLLLADEPTGNLDSQSGAEVIALLEQLNRDLGITLVIVTHDPNIGSRAGRKILMRDGRQVEPRP